MVPRTEGGDFRRDQASPRREEFCWAHLIRDFVKIAERRSDSERIGNALLAEAERMSGWWRRVRDGTLKRSTLVLDVLLAVAALGGHLKHNGEPGWITLRRG